MPPRPLLIVYGILGLLIGVLVTAFLQQRAQTRRLAFRADSLQAVADTTRYISGSWQRRALQAEIRETLLEDSLRQWPKVTTVTVVRIDTVRVLVQAPVQDSQDVRIATFTAVRAEPVTAEATVRLPPAPQPGSLALRVVVDPLPLQIRGVCSRDPNPTTGLRTASITASGPQWAQIQLLDPQVDPKMCNPPTSWLPRLSTGPSWKTTLLLLGGALLTGGVVSQVVLP